MDLIGRGVELWGEERPDLDPSGTEMVWRVLRLGALFWDAIDLVLTPFGLHPRSYSVLAVLRTHGAPSFRLPPRVIREATYLTTGGLTNLLVKMESAGLVERLPDPSDRRSIFVQMTDAGREVIDRAATEVTSLERSLANQLEPGDRDLFADLARLYVLRLDRLAIAPR